MLVEGDGAVPSGAVEASLAWLRVCQVLIAKKGTGSAMVHRIEVIVLRSSIGEVVADLGEGGGLACHWLVMPLLLVRVELAGLGGKHEARVP